MASEFAIPLTAEGSVTAPSGVFSFVEPTAETETFLDVGPVNALELSEFGWALADGVNPLRLVTKGAVYDCGGIAPNVALTATSSAVRATATQTFTAATNPANDDEYRIVGQVGTFTAIVFKSTLSTAPVSYQRAVEIKIGANLAATIANVEAFFNDTGTAGTHYFVLSVPYTAEQIRSGMAVTVSATTATTITYRATVGGTTPNSWTATEIADTGGGGAGTWSITNFSGGTYGTGTSPAAGTYRYFYTWYRDADQAETGRSPITSVEAGEAAQIDITALTASADTTFDYIRIYRTATLGAEFFLVGTVARAATTFTDDVDDETLARNIPPWNDLLHRAYSEGMPPRARALAFWKGSLWSLGAHLHADYTKGTVSVTEGSATITFSVKGVTSRMRGRTFQVDSTSEQYTIISVSESGPTAVIDREYTGSTNGTATFRIIDDYDATAIRRSVEFKWNQQPVDESPGNVDTDDPEGGTALLATTSRLFAFSPTSICAVTGDGPDSWEISKIGQGVGCVAPRLAIGVEGGGVFLSYDGFWAVAQDESLTCISSLKAPKKSLAVGIDETVKRIAWANVDQGYSYFDTENRQIVFGLPLDGALTPNYEIVFDLQNSTWTMFRRAAWTAEGAMTNSDGSQIALAGGREGDLWHVEIGESDGAYGFEAVATLTGAQTVRTLTASGASFPTSGDGLAGVPVAVLYADAVTVAYGKIASNTGTALTLAEDLATAPAASDQVVVGAIAWQWKTGFTTFGEEYRDKRLRSITVRHAPSTRNAYFLSYAVNGGTFSLPPVGTGIGDLTEADGKIRHFTQYPGDTHAINVRGFKPGGRAIFRGVIPELSIRETGNR